MKTAAVKAFIDSYHPSTEGKCSVTIRVTFDRKKKYFKTGIKCTIDEFQRAMNDKYRKEADKKLFKEINSFVIKANDIIDKLPVFTFNKFEDLYYSNEEATDTIKYSFESYIKELRENDRIGTAITYEAAIKSLESFKPGLKFADIDKRLLQRYEKWMLSEDQGNSKTTVGIYLRNLRAIFNKAKIDRSLYPFGKKNDPNAYAIPKGKNIKKALTLEDIGKIFNYETVTGTTMDMAKDYWIFIYLCNGINVKDMCLLKHKNIDGDYIRFERAKTINTADEPDIITISLKPQAKEVIRKWGIKSLSPESYLFPHLQRGMDAVRQREIYQQLTKTINKYMKIISKELKLPIEATTYVARHSFSTILRNSGASVEYISEALGHSDIKTTKNYLASFEDKTISSVTDALTNFKTA